MRYGSIRVFRREKLWRPEAGSTCPAQELDAQKKRRSDNRLKDVDFKADLVIKR
jgi:hypothetical protein